MNVSADQVIPVPMPQMNANDDAVTVVDWRVSDGDRVEEGQPLCEVETSKAVGEVPAPAGGLVRPLVQVGEVVETGRVFALIGPTIADIEAYARAEGRSPGAESEPAGSLPHGDARRSPTASQSTGNASPNAAGAPVESPSEVQVAADGPIDGISEATAGAVELARRWGIDLADVPARGRVRRGDVEAFIRDRGLTMPAPASAAWSGGGAADLPSALIEQVEAIEPLTAHQSAIAEHLARTQGRLVPAHVMMDVRMEAALRWIEARQRTGMVAGVLPLLLHAAAVALGECQALRCFRLGRRVYRYRAMDVAYTARDRQGRLFTPVVRAVDERSLDELVAECARLNMAIFRDQVQASDLGGACLTVSLLSEPPVRMHVGLQNAYQSAILTAGAVREEVIFVQGAPAAVPVTTLTLSYDHGLMDGQDAANALDIVRRTLESVE